MFIVSCDARKLIDCIFILVLLLFINRGELNRQQFIRNNNVLLKALMLVSCLRANNVEIISDNVVLRNTITEESSVEYVRFLPFVISFITFWYSVIYLLII